MMKKDFALIAESLRNTKPKKLPVGNFDERLWQWRMCCNEVANALHQTNPRFDFERFLEACGFEN